MAAAKAVETRTIRSGIGSYVGIDGLWSHGVFGDVVEVHKDDLERFDRLNPEQIPAAVSATGPTFSQEDIDTAVQAANDAKDAEIAEARKALEAAHAELEKFTADAAKTPAAK